MERKLQLEIGASYVNGEGQRRTIAGRCRDYPQWVWSQQGDWFDPETGAAIWYDAERGQHYVGPPSYRDLREREFD